MARTLRVIELFSGVGSQRMALERIAGDIGVRFEFIAQCDVDPRASRVYDAIHGETENLGDVTAIERLPDCDLLTWSFPCQSLSQAGRKEGMERGSGTASSLAWEVVRLLGSSHRPEWLVMENVPQITNQINIKEFNAIISALSALGYVSRYRMMCALDYGVPQTRTRCFMVSRYRAPVPDFPPPSGLAHTLGDYLEDDADPALYLSPQRLSAIVRQSEEQRARGNGFAFKPVSREDNARTITTNPDRKCSTWVMEPVYVRTNNSAGWMPGWPGDGVVLGQPQARGVVRPRLSPTLTTHAGGTGVITPDARIRALSPRECWRLMGLCRRLEDGTFDDAPYETATALVSKTQMYRLAGNAIVVDVLKALFVAMLSPSAGCQTSLQVAI